MSPLELRHMRLCTCVHFRGIQNQCDAGIDPASTAMKPAQGLMMFACLAHRHTPDCAPQCPSFRATTIEELEAEDREVARIEACIAKGISPCCNVVLIVEGTRCKVGYCSKCRKIAFRT